MMKGKKRWLTALIAALSAAIAALVQPDAAPLVQAIVSPLVVEPEPLEPLELDPKQCASNWSACPQTQ